MKHKFTSWLLIFFIISSLFSGLLITFDPDNIVVKGNLIYINNYGAGNTYSVCGDGTYIYAVEPWDDQILAYSFNGTGFTLLNTTTDASAHFDVWCSNGYIFSSAYGEGLRVYTFDGTDFTLIDSDDQGDSYRGVWSNGDYVFCNTYTDGVYGYSFDGSTLTYLDDARQGGICYGTSVYYDGTYIYAAGYGDGLRVYSFDGSTFSDMITRRYDGGEYYGLSGDGNYIYTSCADDGLRAYSFNGDALTLLDTITTPTADQYTDVWVQAGYIFVATDDAGIAAYTFDGNEFTYINSPNAVHTNGVYCDGTYIYGCGINQVLAYGMDGQLIVNLFNESSPTSPISNWGILITDESENFIYSNYTATNPLIIDTWSLGIGDINIYVNATGYLSRSYYVDIQPYTDYYLDAFLPPQEEANLYYIQVLSETNNPIFEADIEIIRFLNGTYRTISSGLTNGYGLFSIYLIPEVEYRINISKSGYNPIFMQNLLPDPNYYGINNPIIYWLSFKDIYYLNETMWHESVFFTVETSGTTLYTNYTDVLTNTTDTHMVVLEQNGSTGLITPFAWYNTTDTDTWTHTNTINNSNCYIVYLYVNHSNWQRMQTIGPIIVCGDNQTYRGITSKTNFNYLFDLNYGSNPFGWSNIFGFMLMVIGLFGFGQVNSGVSIILTGFVLLVVNNIIGLAVIGVLVPVLFIFLGILVLWGMHRRIG